MELVTINSEMNKLSEQLSHHVIAKKSIPPPCVTNFNSDQNEVNDIETDNNSIIKIVDVNNITKFTNVNKINNSSKFDDVNKINETKMKIEKQISEYVEKVNLLKKEYEKCTSEIEQQVLREIKRLYSIGIYKDYSNFLIYVAQLSDFFSSKTIRILTSLERIDQNRRERSRCSFIRQHEIIIKSIIVSKEDIKEESLDSQKINNVLDDILKNIEILQTKYVNESQQYIIQEIKRSYKNNQYPSYILFLNQAIKYKDYMPDEVLNKLISLKRFERSRGTHCKKMFIKQHKNRIDAI